MCWVLILAMMKSSTWSACTAIRGGNYYQNQPKTKGSLAAHQAFPVDQGGNALPPAKIVKPRRVNDIPTIYAHSKCPRSHRVAEGTSYVPASCWR